MLMDTTTSTTAAETIRRAIVSRRESTASTGRTGADDEDEKCSCSPLKNSNHFSVSKLLVIVAEALQLLLEFCWMEAASA